MLKHRLKKTALARIVLCGLLSVGVFTFSSLRSVQAADNDFSNGITVESTGDGADADTNDSICADISGDCTLRAAIEESNDTVGTQTIRFNITGTADFTNGGQNGYTIQPQSALPNITDTVIIDGYSQPGSQANTAVAPNPLNGILLIEINGSGAGATNGLTVDGNNSTIRGLVINNFSSPGQSGIAIGSDNLTLQGNYIGTEPDGMTAADNEGGITQGADNSTGALIGGLNPADRNLISGNSSVGSSPNTGSDNWTYQGNYIGVGKDGLTAIANAQPDGSGALSLDNSNGHIVGGPEAGAINVISGNSSMGIAPHNSDNLLIEGNYIGVGYDGATPLGNGKSPINLSGGCDNAQILDNVIANSPSQGININESSNSAVVQGNFIESSSVAAIGILDSSNAQIGGTGASEGNTIETSGYGVLAIQISGTTSNNIIKGNIISDSFISGIAIVGASNTIIGGAEAGAGNSITDSTDAGIAVHSLTMSAVPLTVTSQNTAILGNSISNSTLGPLNSGLGIDLLEMTDASGPPDFVPESFSEIGATLNDPSDADTGPNNYINYPVINSASQNLLNLNVNFDLDAADSPTNQYRVEFFANDTADPTGYGEGQTFLGSTTVSPGSDQVANLTLPAGTNLTGKVLSATTTAIDGTTNTGFGSTSEFSRTQTIIVSALSQGDAENNQAGGNLADTGQDIRLFGVVGVSIIALSAYLARRARKYTYTTGR